MFTIHLSLGYAKDLYALLGLKKTATSKEIKKAYREKARQTHPDKNKGENVEETTAQFREIVDAFETLSDKAAREHYDRTGASMNQQKKGRNNEHNSNWNWGFNFNFQHQQQNPKYHHFLYDPYRKHQILDAQSRTINIRPTLDHLFSVIHTDEDNPVVERYILLAFFDSSQQQCADLLRYQVLYPWPFAGYTQEGSGGMWWEEIVMTLKVDLNPETTVADDAQRLMEHFGLAFGKGGRMLPEQCPSFSVITRGDSGLNRQSTKHLSDTESFRSWVRERVEGAPIHPLDCLLKVTLCLSTSLSSIFFCLSRQVWQQLKMSVTIVNRTPWVVHSWWVDGHRGVRKDNLEVGARYPISTFISHTFFFRADFVEGNALTNEVSGHCKCSRVRSI